MSWEQAKKYKCGCPERATVKIRLVLFNRPRCPDCRAVMDVVSKGAVFVACEERTERDGNPRLCHP